MGSTAFDGNLDLDELFFQRVLKYVPKYKAAKLFAHLLQIATNDKVSTLYHSCGLCYNKELEYPGIPKVERVISFGFSSLQCDVPYRSRTGPNKLFTSVFS